MLDHPRAPSSRAKRATKAEQKIECIEMCAPYQLYRCSCSCSATAEEACSEEALADCCMLLLLVAVGCGSECPAKTQNLLHVEAAVVEAAGLPARPLAQRLSDETVWQDHACPPAKPRDSCT
jgi:hypothetical protein